MSLADLKAELTAVAAYIEHTAMSAEIVPGDAGCGLAARKGRSEAHPSPRSLVIPGSIFQCAAVREKLEGTGAADKPAGVGHKRAEKVRKIGEDKTRKFQLGLHKIAISEGVGEPGRQAYSAVLLAHHSVRFQKTEQHVRAQHIDRQAFFDLCLRGRPVVEEMVYQARLKSARHGPRLDDAGHKRIDAQVVPFLRIFHSSRF